MCVSGLVTYLQHTVSEYYLYCLAGHLTYECRNFIKLDKQNIHLDVSSTSSEEDSEEDNEVSVPSTSSPSSSEDDRKRKKSKNISSKMMCVFIREYFCCVTKLLEL